MRLARRGALLLLLLAGLLALMLATRTGREVAAAAAEGMSWEEARDEIFAQLGFSDAYRAEWLAGQWVWPRELDQAGLREALARPALSVSEPELRGVRDAIEPLWSEFEVLSGRFLDVLEAEVLRAWAEGRFEKQAVDAGGRATFPMPPRPAFYSTTAGYAGWAIRITIENADVPEAVALGREIGEIKRRRLASVLAVLGEPPHLVPAPGAGPVPAKR